MTKEEFLKEKLNKEELEILLRHQADILDFIDLSDLDLKGFNIELNGLEAENIFNYNQKAKRIFNHNQKAERISNNRQQAKFINNRLQEAKRIDNDNQKLKQ